MVNVAVNETFWRDTVACQECERAKRRGQLLAQEVDGGVRDFGEVEFELLERSADELAGECVVLSLVCSSRRDLSRRACAST